jgi:uncharacterized protein YbjT (DUF2867 family)
MTLLILGGTGSLGRQVVARALENSFYVRCIVRNKQTGKFLQEWGTDLVYGDLIFPETLPISFQGITAIIDVSTTRSNDESEMIDVEWLGKLILIELSKRVNVEQFIFFSIINAEKYSYIFLMRLKNTIEKILKTSGLPYTIFRCAGFFQGFINQYAIPILENKPIWVTTENIPIWYIDTQDAATFCIKSLLLKQTKNKSFFLGTEKPWVSNSIIRLCEKLSGQKAQIQNISLFILKIIRQITSFFKWTNKISDRLAFVEVLRNYEDLNFSASELYETFELKSRKFLSLENYLREYFEIILVSLEKIKVEGNSKTFLI